MKPKHPLLFAAGCELAINATDLPEWIQLAPFGEHPTRDKARVQVFNAAAAEQVVAWFEFFPRRVARLMGINAVPVWVGHPDFDSKTWPDKRQIGSVTALEAREDGLWGKVAWNAEAGPALRDEGHKYPSVAWDCDEAGPGRLSPAMLWSVGMWRTPNIKSVQAVINADPTDLTDPTDAEQTNDEPNDDMKLREMLVNAGLIAADADDSAVETAMAGVIAGAAAAATAAEEVTTELNAVRTERETLTAEVTSLQTRLAEVNAARVSDALIWLIETGRIAKADEPQVLTELNADFAAALDKWKEKKVQLNTARLNLSAAKVTVHESAERAKKINEWIAQRMATTNCSYDEAWVASKSDAEIKALHEAMNREDETRGE